MGFAEDSRKVERIVAGSLAGLREMYLSRLQVRACSRRAPVAAAHLREEAQAGLLGCQTHTRPHSEAETLRTLPAAAAQHQQLHPTPSLLTSGWGAAAGEPAGSVPHPSSRLLSSQRLTQGSCLCHEAPPGQGAAEPGACCAGGPPGTRGQPGRAHRQGHQAHGPCLTPAGCRPPTPRGTPPPLGTFDTSAWAACLRTRLGCGGLGGWSPGRADPWLALTLTGAGGGWQGAGAQPALPAIALSRHPTGAWSCWFLPVCHGVTLAAQGKVQWAALHRCC